jgi:hypothetical protein
MSRDECETVSPRLKLLRYSERTLQARRAWLLMALITVAGSAAFFNGAELVRVVAVDALCRTPR